MKYSGRTSAYAHKHDFDPSVPLSPDTDKGLRKAWFLDAQWSTCPVEVESQVKDLWRCYELGNDRYILKTSIDELLNMVDEGATVKKFVDGKWTKVPLQVDYIVDYIQQHGIAEDEQVIIHWWW